MRTIIFLLAMTSITVAHAEIYKCPGKVEGQYTYQKSSCKGAKADQHTLKIVPFDTKIVAEAQEKLAKEIEVNKAKEEGKQLPATVTPTTTTTLVPIIMPQNSSSPPVNSGTANTTNSLVNPSPVIIPTSSQTNVITPTPLLTPAPTVTPSILPNNQPTSAKVTH